MKEIDQFLKDWAAPTLRERGYRKTGHTFRRQYSPSGDWAVFNFRNYPLGLLGSFTVNAAFVPEPLLDWFNYAHSSMAMKAPTADWAYWAHPITPYDDYKWAYNDLDGREDRGRRLVARLEEVTNAFDTLVEPETLLDLVELARTPELVQIAGLPNFGATLHHPLWRVSVLARSGTAADLHAALSACNPYPALKAHSWASSRVGPPKPI